MTCGLASSETKTTCPYCGVGCGVLAVIDPANVVSIAGDVDHPANFGKLCSKGSALAETLGLEGRLLTPQVNGVDTSWDSALNQIAHKFSKMIEEYGPNSVAFYVSGQLLTEDYYVANKLMKGYIGSANIDTNSRLCMASSVVGHKRAFGADIVPGCYEDLELADLIVLTGSNLAWCHPVLYQRIIAAKSQRSDLKIVVIDPRKTASCDVADMHLPLAPGSDVALYQGLFSYLDHQGCQDTNFVKNHTNDSAKVKDAAKAFDLDTVAQTTSLSPSTLTKFYKLFMKTEKVVTVYSQGVNQARDGTDKVNAIINCHLLTGRIGKPGAGPFSVTGQPNAMGGREVGGLANQLASHMDIGNALHRNIVKRFWNSPTIANAPGLMAVELFDAIHAGTIKAIWIMATNPVDSMPNANHVRAALEKCDLVIVSDICASTDTIACADVVLPSTGWGEKDGTVTNSERRISRQRKFLPAPGEARDDWWQLCEVAKRMGFETGFGFETATDIFREYASLCAFENEGVRDLDLSGLTDISDAQYDTLEPIQWPVTKASPAGLTRFFEDKKYFTQNGKANFVSPAAFNAVTATEDYPFVLNTGRIRDQWHTMTRTGRASRLAQHICEPFVEIHPTDAKNLVLENADIAILESAYGEMHARVKVTSTQKMGSMFAPMHFTDSFASQGRVDALTHPVVDPLSGQPALKSTSIRAKKFPAKWYGFAALVGEVFQNVKAPDQASYWGKARVAGGVRIEIAGVEILENPKALFEELLNISDPVEILETTRPLSQQARFACISMGRVVGLLYIDKSPVAASREWVCSQLGTEPKGASRYRLLAGRPGSDMPDAGAIICACMQVGINEIKACILAGCQTVDDIGDETTAGTNCGSCQPEIRAFLREMQLVDVE